MITLLTGSTLFSCIVILTVVNVILWIFEYFVASLRYLACFILKKPNTWSSDIFSTKLLFTRVLLIVCFAMLSPLQIVHHRKLIRDKELQRIHKKHNKANKRQRKAHKVLQSIHHHSKKHNK